MAVALPGRLRVELHAHGRDVRDLSEMCFRISWRDSTQSPWESISLQMRLAISQWAGLIPSVGEWVVIRDEDGRALSWGYITSVSGSLSVSGDQVQTSPITVEAVSWWDLLGRASVYVAGGFVEDDVGTLFSFSWWEPVIQRIAESSTGRLGHALAETFKLIARVLLPETLAGIYLGYGVRVVYDTVTASAHAPDVAVDPVEGPTLEGLQHLITHGASVQGLILGTWAADQHLVEVFPALVEYGRPPPRDAWEGQYQKSPNGTVYWLDGHTFKPGEGHQFPTGFREKRGGEPPPSPPPPTAASTALGDVLGRNPVLVYRMTPWRTDAPADFLANPASIRRDIFAAATWDTGSAQLVRATDLVSLSLSWQDDVRVNAVAPGVPNDPDSELGFMNAAGLPLYGADRIRRDGLRLYRPEWPFFPPRPKTGDDTGSFVAFVRTVAAHAAVTMTVAERFASGTAKMPYRPDLQKGRPVRFVVPGLTIGDGTVTGYVVSIRHTWEITPDTGWMARTELDVDRMLLDESLRRLSETTANNIIDVGPGREVDDATR